MMARAPDFRNGRLMLAATYAHMEELDEARRQVKELLRIEPDCSLKKLSRQHYFHSAEQGLHMLEGLRKAGVPEK
jgi:hypothetical protein